MGKKRHPLKIVFAFSPYPKEGASFRYRILQYADTLAEHGYTLQTHSFMDSFFYSIRRKRGLAATILKTILFLWSFLRLLPALRRAIKSDMVIIHREIFPLGPPVFEKLVLHFNPNVIFDVDDAIFNAPTAGLDQRRFLKDQNKFPTIIGRCRCVAVGSPYLEKQVMAWNSRTEILPTSIDTASYSPKLRGRNAIPVIGWIGNWGNAFYLEYLLGIFSELAESIPFRIKLVGGVDIFELKLKDADIIYKVWKPEDEINDVASFDIGIMPLKGGDYDVGKGGFKLIQYMGMGIPVVASPIGINCEIVEDGVNGFLAASPQQWRDSLKRLLTDPELRAKMGLNGRTKIERFYSKAATGQKLVNLINEVLYEKVKK